MTSIETTRAKFLATICQYWEIKDAESRHQLATSEGKRPFDQVFEEWMANENIKGLVLYFGHNRADARREPYYIATDAFADSGEDIMMLASERRNGLSGLGLVPSKGNNGMSMENVQAMIANAVGQQQVKQQKESIEQQFEFMSKMLENSKAMMQQQIDFERERLDHERRIFEESKELAGEKGDVWERVISGIATLAPIVTGLAGLGSITPPEKPKSEAKEAAPIVEARQKEAVKFTVKPKGEAVAKEAPSILAGLSPKMQERLLKLAQEIEADPELMDQIEDFVKSPEQEDDEAHP